MKKYFFLVSSLLFLLAVAIREKYIFPTSNQAAAIEAASKIKCPEHYLTAEEKVGSVTIFIEDFKKKYPDATVEDLLGARYDFLADNNCEETLNIFRTNSAFRDVKCLPEYKTQEERFNAVEAAYDKYFEYFPDRNSEEFASDLVEHLKRIECVIPEKDPLAEAL